MWRPLYPIYRAVVGLFCLAIASPVWGLEESSGQAREKESFQRELQKVPTLKEEKEEAAKPAPKKWVAWPSAAGVSFTYFEDSDEDRTRQLTETVQVWQSDKLSVVYGNDLAKYEDRGSPNIYLLTNWIEIKSALSENLSTALFYGFKDYHNGRKDEQVYSATLNHILKDRLLTTLQFSHFDIIENNPAILENLEVHQWSSLFDLILNKNLSVQSGYIGSDYSDDNYSYSFYGQGTIVWLDHPILSTSYQYSFTSFSFESPFYFSFDDFQNHLLSLSWEHNIAKNLGYAFRNYIFTDNADPGDWASQLAAEIYFAPWSFFSLLLQYSYYDSEVLSGNSFTSNTVYVGLAASF